MASLYCIYDIHYRIYTYYLSLALSLSRVHCVSFCLFLGSRETGPGVASLLRSYAAKAASLDVSLVAALMNEGTANVRGNPLRQRETQETQAQQTDGQRHRDRDRERQRERRRERQKRGESNRETDREGDLVDRETRRDTALQHRETRRERKRETER